MPYGFVSLVGAGPGDAELLTVKGLRRLREADVVVYDALVARELLNECRQGAELIYVGKRAGLHHCSQEAINRLLVERARAGSLVVRLKGGDPFVFGRGGEEAEALEAAGIPWEVVPGVSAAIAAPAYAGIPVTHRALSSSVAFVTGHEDPGKGRQPVDWRALAKSVDTLVVLMGLNQLASIAARLIAAGRSAQTPAAVIARGTCASQEVLTAPLADIAQAVVDAGLEGPALIVIGEVVRLRDRLAWFEPLVQPAAAWLETAEPLRVGR